MDKTAYTDSQLIAMIRSGDDSARKEALKHIYEVNNYPGTLFPGH